METRTARIEFWNFLDCDLTVKAVSTKLLKRVLAEMYVEVGTDRRFVGYEHLKRRPNRHCQRHYSL